MRNVVGKDNLIFVNLIFENNHSDWSKPDMYTGHLAVQWDNY